MIIQFDLPDDVFDCILKRSSEHGGTCFVVHFAHRGGNNGEMEVYLPVSDSCSHPGKLVDYIHEFDSFDNPALLPASFVTGSVPADVVKASIEEAKRSVLEELKNSKKTNLPN